jgi:hypothetical protein
MTEVLPLLSRLALKIVVGARELLTGNTEESFGRFYFSSHTFKFFGLPSTIHSHTEYGRNPY